MMQLEYYKVEKQKKRMVYDCPYNEGCRCTDKRCYSCGWNPIVAKRRSDAQTARNKETTL